MAVAQDMFSLVFAFKDQFNSVAGEDPRRTPLREKRAIYGWKLLAF